MAYKSVLAIGLSLVLAGGVASIAACSSDDDDKNPATPDSGAAASCATAASFFECQVCCQVPATYFDGQVALENCFCDEACKDECESACGADAGTASPQCETCINSQAAADTCRPKAQAVCTADPACVAYQECAVASNCADKP